MDEKRILLVDDSPVIRGIGKRILNGKGFFCALAEDGQQALKFFSSSHYDLVILDYHMPKLNGLQVVNAIRNGHGKTKWSNAPIIIFSVEDSPSIINKLIEAGANDHLLKNRLSREPEVFLEKIYALLNFQEELVRCKDYRLKKKLNPYIKDLRKKVIELTQIVHHKQDVPSMLPNLRHLLGIVLKEIEEGSLFEIIFDTPKDDDYFASHSANCALLTMFIGLNVMNWSHEKIISVAVGAIFHDFGNIAGEKVLLRNPSALNESEFEYYTNHVNSGAEFGALIGLEKEALGFIENHHERIDGSGYPLGKTEKSLNDVARVALIIDTFDSLTFSRAGHDKRFMAREAIRKMKSWEGQFDLEILNEFDNLTREIGFKPIGES